jgi:hypothetical protein
MYGSSVLATAVIASQGELFSTAGKVGWPASSFSSQNSAYVRH